MPSYKCYIPKQTSSPLRVRDAYSFNPRKRLKWLQRLCIRILDRLGCWYFYASERIDYIEIEFDSLAKLILSQSDAIERLFNEKPKYLIVGREQMMHLGVETEFPQFCLSFPPEYKARVRMGGNIYPNLFCGITVVVVPWFNGILPLCELE